MSKSIQTLVVASTNPVKVQAAANGFHSMFPNLELNIVSVAVASGVRQQPLSDTETLTGALQRVQNASLLMPDADYWIGIEGGIDEQGAEMLAFAWVVAGDQRRSRRSSRSLAF
jgi:inosine/xanthosine triphosphatase